MTKKFRLIASLASAALAMSLMSPLAASASTCAGLDYQGCDLRNAKFVGVGPQLAKRLDLKNANFSGANLSGAEFTNVWLDGASFANANLTSVKFSASNGTAVNFQKTDMTSVVFTAAEFLNTDFSSAKFKAITTSGQAYFYQGNALQTKFPKDWHAWGANLIGPGAIVSGTTHRQRYPMPLPTNEAGAPLNLEGLQCTACDFYGLDLSGANFKNATFNSGVTFLNANLTGANFTGAKAPSRNMGGFMSGVVFKGSNLSSANLSYSEFPNSIFEGANLSKTNFGHAKLVEPNFSKTNLVGANFSKVNLSGVSFSEADLGKINLSDAVLTSVDVSDANLTGANLTGLLATEVYGNPIGLPKGWKILGSRLAATFVKTGIPTVTGTYSKGSTLSAVPGTWDAGTKFKYQWKRNGFAIPKATSQKYKLTANDSGQNISVSVIGVKPDRFEITKTSSPKKSK